MSDNPFYHDYMGTSGGINTFPFFGENPSNYHDQPIIPNIQNPNHEHQFVPSSYMTLTECLHGSMDYNTLSSVFGMSCSSSSEVVCPHIDNQGSTRKSSVSATAEPILDSPMGDQTSVEVPPTPNSSISSTSNEAGGQEDSSKIKKHMQNKDGQEGRDDKSKKECKATKKGEKKVKEPRFAFMTKSEIDNLEDGYRWRKYGQKAVKNSPFPRNYYRCTTQKCSVKKRVERSYEDASIVITTYEGQHNHHCPAALRGNASFLSSPHFMPSFPPQLFSQMLIPPTSNQNLLITSEAYNNINNNNYHQQNQGSEYNLFGGGTNDASWIQKQEPS
ncbi:putative WRKY transcription factor 23 [Capsicum annuum]|uniref:WRKY transcription factor 23 n=1 Tax=Capsicum annuum TaxID=4072 RepID=A0A2G2YT55_CAPAN|nr:WRKY transcription factor 71-like [Capsicum annuum]KAF3622752.1 putative WRKY transcription factor 23 [Capsicum annuum]KAF3680401.1 putative WRKY transcription factor 23 [Capsicum annuum]PHT72948.1 putative WRKY transcription factor 23 [Capsicum annuum]